MKLSDLFTPEELFRAIVANEPELSLTPERQKYLDQIVEENKPYFDALRPTIFPGGFSPDQVYLIGSILCTIDLILRERTIQ